MYQYSDLDATLGPCTYLEASANMPNPQFAGNKNFISASGLKKYCLLYTSPSPRD